MRSVIVHDFQTLQLRNSVEQSPESRGEMNVFSLSVEPQVAQDGLPHLIIFTGFGETRQTSLLAAARPFAEQGFKTRSIGIPFDSFSLNDSDWAIKQGLGELVGRLQPKDQPVLLAGVSRGAAIAANLMTNPLIEQTGLIMISPLGLSKVPKHAYLARTIADYVAGKGYLDKQARSTAYSILREMSNHARSKDGLRKALNFAMSQQAGVHAGIVATQKQEKLLAIFSGDKDRVFTANESRIVLNELVGTQYASDVFHTMSGGHATVASKTGQQQLKTVAEWLATTLS